MDGQDRRSRGVRLSDLDRSLVYRIAYSGRRWEVLGPEGPRSAVGAPGGPDAGAGRVSGEHRDGTPGRHAAPGLTDR